MEIILSRHGNTFRPNEPPVWVDRKLDLPLVEAGEEQARALARRLKADSIIPEAVFAAPLVRTKRFAEIVATELALHTPPIIDERLSELDYGWWSGKTQEEIIAMSGADELTAWSARSVWPTRAGWASSEEEVIREVHEFVEDLRNTFSRESVVLVVSSNGRLRFFLKLVAGEFERRVAEGTFAMKTGAMGKIRLDEGGARVDYWNISPEAPAITPS